MIIQKVIAITALACMLFLLVFVARGIPATSPEECFSGDPAARPGVLVVNTDHQACWKSKGFWCAKKCKVAP